MLDGRRSPGVKDEAVQLLLRHRPEVTSVKITNSSCTDTGLWAVLTHPGVHTVHFDDSAVTGEEIYKDNDTEDKDDTNTKPYLKKKEEYSDNLEDLSLAYCERLTDLGLRVILCEVGNKLTSLRLTGTHITLNGVATMTCSLDRLQSLDLSCCFRYLKKIQPFFSYIYIFFIKLLFIFTSKLFAPMYI